MTDLNHAFENAAPQDLLRWAVQTYSDKLAVVTSFQPTGIVILHMLQAIAPQTVVLSLDTGLLFPETYALMDTIEQRFKLRLIRVRPRQTVAEQTAAYGPNLWAHDPDTCCNLRKVVPLGVALSDYAAWITGLRRDQSTARQTVQMIAKDEKYGKIKLSPLATWTEQQVWSYIYTHDLPYNTLHDRQYPTIGCHTCTQPVNAGAIDLRAGRWIGHEKTECGLHTTR